MAEVKLNNLNLTHTPSNSTIPITSDNLIDDNPMPAILVGILVPHGVCTLFILARVFSRVFLLRKWFIDDSLIFVAWLFSTGVCVVYSIAAETPEIIGAPDESLLQAEVIGQSQHLNGGNVTPYLLRTYLGLIFYQLCLCLTKLSILALYLRMFSSRPRERILAWCTVVFVLMYGVPMLFMSVFQCHPGEGYFFGRPMMCFGFAELLISSASLHTATDAWLILMIVPCIVRLDLPPKQKVALAIVLSLSIFVIAASMVRLQLSLHRHFRPSSAGVSNTLAFYVMTVLECDIALICASAPTLRPLLAKIFPRWMKDTRRRSLETTDGASFDLTSVVSYHGYPWTAPTTPMQRSRTGSIASHLNKLTQRMPVPPLPTLAINHRTPTTLSLRSMLTSVAPRSRGRALTGDGRPILDEYVRDSAGFDAYYDNYEQDDQMLGRTMSIKTRILSIREWGESQESFVLGKNDPLSPTHPSPTSGWSGATCAALDDARKSAASAPSLDERLEVGLTPDTPRLEKRQETKP